VACRQDGLTAVASHATLGEVLDLVSGGGDVDNVKKTTIRLPAAVWKAARVRALDEGTDFQAVVTRALEQYLKTALKRREGQR
jgi:hypothetical protein